MPKVYSTRNKVGKLVEMWKDPHTLHWIIGIQGTSEWYSELSSEIATETFLRLEQTNFN